MKVKKGNIHTFEFVTVGQCFYFNASIYLKMFTYNLGDHNSINLQTGYPCSFDSNTEVELHENALLVY